MADTARKTLTVVGSSLLAAVLTIVGWSWFGGRAAGAIETKIQGLETRVERLEREGETTRQYLRSIEQQAAETNQRLARIEGKLDRR